MIRMKTFLFTVYTIKTMVTQVEADSIEEARQIVEDPEADLSWLMIPEATYNFFSHPFEEEE
jgi:hypothetical protein